MNDGTHPGSAQLLTAMERVSLYLSFKFIHIKFS